MTFGEESTLGPPLKTAIWAILANRSDLVSDPDRLFSEYIDDTHEERFPGLFDEVFIDCSATGMSDIRDTPEYVNTSIYVFDCEGLP